MGHRHLRRLLDAHLDGELDDPEATALAEHLLECPPCASDAAVTARIKAVLERIGAADPSPLAGARLRRFASSLAERR